MKRTIIAISFLLSATLVGAQSSHLLWAGKVGGKSVTSIGGITTDGVGNTYITGSFDDTVDFDPGPGVSTMTTGNGYNPLHNLSTIFVEKLDPQGNFLWVRKFDGYSNRNIPCAIAVDQAGYIYSSGLFGDTVDFDPGPAEYKLVSPPSFDSVGYSSYLCKLDASGNFIWAKRIANCYSSNKYYTSMVLDKWNHIAMIAHFIGSQDIDPGAGIYNVNGDASLVLKLDSSANLIWARQPSLNGIVTMAVDNSGNFYWAGSANPDTTFISKNDSAGINVWIRSFNTDSFSSVYGLVVDHFGSVYSTGSHYGTCDFDPGPGTHNVTSIDRESYILKLDSRGNFVWVTGINGYAYTGPIKIDASNNAYIAGAFTNTIYFYSDILKRKFTGQGQGSAFILKLNGLGDFVLADIISGAPGVLFDIDKTGAIDAAGNFGSTIDVDPGSGVTNLTASSFCNVFIIKLDDGSSNGVQIFNNAPISILPIPASNHISVLFESEQQFTSIQIMDQTGKVIKSVNYSGRNLLIDRGGISDGLYYLRVLNKKKGLSLVEKIIFN